MMMDSPNEVGRNEQFHITTRSHSQPSTIEMPKQVKVVIKKISPSALNPSPTDKKNATLPKSVNQTESVDRIVEKNTPSHSHVQPSLAGKKRKIREVIPSPKPRVKKRKQTVAGNINKKAAKASSVSVQRKVKPRVAHSSPGKICKASKNCDGGAEKDGSINMLKRKINELEEREASMQNRLTIYEGLGLSHLQREEENKTLLKKKFDFQEKLSKLEEEYSDYLEKEDAEMKYLLHKRDILKRSLAEERDKNERFDPEEEADLKRIRDENEKLIAQNEKDKIEIVALEAEYEVLKQKVAEEEKKFRPKPKELPAKEPVQGPCEICKKLKEQKETLKKEVKELELEGPALKKEYQALLEQVKVGAADIFYLKYEIEYLRTRIFTQRNYNSEDDWVQDQACWDDHYHRNEFTEKACKLMCRHFRDKSYAPEPKMCPLRKSKLELYRIEQCKKEGSNMCCTYLSDDCCRILCDRLKKGISETMSKEERIKFETTSPGWNECCKYPGLIETEEGKQAYMKYAAYWSALLHDIDKCFKPVNPFKKKE